MEVAPNEILAESLVRVLNGVTDGNLSGGPNQILNGVLNWIPSAVPNEILDGVLNWNPSAVPNEIPIVDIDEPSPS